MNNTVTTMPYKIDLLLQEEEQARTEGKIKQLKIDNKIRLNTYLNEFKSNIVKDIINIIVLTICTLLSIIYNIPTVGLFTILICVSCVVDAKENISRYKKYKQKWLSL